MKPGLRIVAWTVFVATLLIALVIGAFVAWVFSEVAPPGSTITIDDDRFVMPAFTHAGHYALAVLGVWVAALVIVAVMPVVIMLGLVLPALLGALGTVLVVGVVALLLWPVYGFAKRLWKRSRARSAERASDAPATPQ
jgi:small-conductance mechanosensitive channel